MTDEIGLDQRGAWVRDKDTGTSIRFGEIGYELAATILEHGNQRLADATLKKPVFGFWFSKSF